MSRGFGSTLGAGTTDIITTSYNTQPTGLRSYSWWMNINGTGGGGIGRVWDSTSNNLNVGDIYDMAVSGSNPGYQRNFSTSNGSWNIPGPLTTGVWHHMAIAYDDTATTNKPVIYKDGVSQTVTTTLTPSGTAVTTAATYCIGNRQTSVNRNWDGLIAHWAVWTGVLLTAGDVLALSAGFLPILFYPQYLRAYLPLDGISNPEFDFINGVSASITGTKLGTSNPAVQPLSKIRRLFDYETNSVYAPILARSLTGELGGSRNFVGL